MSNKNDGTDLLDRTDEKIKKPSMWRVILLNDDYTPMDFVVFLLEKIFRKSTQEAEAITLDVHHKGTGTAGVFTLEVAESKALEAMALAKKERHPLRCAVEKDS